MQSFHEHQSVELEQRTPTPHASASVSNLITVSVEQV